MTAVVTLYRPVGTAELKLIEQSGWTAFPPRLPGQPIFYPVTNESYAAQIARDWNAVRNEDHRGYVTRFAVDATFISAYRREVVGGREHEEYWIPAEDLDAFNAAIVGPIVMVAAFEGRAQTAAPGVEEPEAAAFGREDEPMSPHDPRAEALARERGTPEDLIARIKEGLLASREGRVSSSSEVFARLANRYGR